MSTGIDLLVTGFGDLTFNGEADELVAVRDGSRLMPPAEAIYVERADDFAFLAGKNLPGYVMALRFSMEGDIYENRDDLREAFYVGDLEPRALTGVDRNDENKEWSVMATAVDATEDSQFVTILLALESPIWKADAVVTEWPITASGDTVEIEVGGTVKALPKFRFTAQNAKSGDYGYKKPYFIYSQSDNEAVDYPLDITDGGEDVKALADAGKMLATCYDWRLWVDDNEEEDRWVEGAYTTTGKMFGLLHFAPRIEVRLDGAMAGTGDVDTISIKKTPTNLAALTRLARVKNRVLLIGTEAFTFSQGGVDLVDYTIDIVSREAFGTSMAVHADNSVVRWLEHNIWTMYDNASAAAPDTDDSKKPLLTLSTSDNTHWYQTIFKAATPRAAAWKASIVSTLGKLSDYYTDAHGEDTATATTMGMLMKAWKKANIWKSETATIEWVFIHPFAALKKVTGVIEKYRAKTSWTEFSGCKKSNDLVKWITVWNDTTPSSAASWGSPVTHSAVDLGGSYKAVKFSLDGNLPNIANNAIYYEATETMLELNSALVPVIVKGVEQSNYQFNIALAHMTTGDILRVRVQCALGDVVEIDCENREILVNGRISGAMPTGTWLTAVKGTNIYKFIDVGTTDVDGEVEIAERRIL